MAGDRQGARPRRAKGQETSTEGNCDLMASAVLTCVHAGRRVLQGRKHSGKGGGGRPKKTKQKPQAPPEGEQHRANRRRGNGKEQAVQKRGHGWRKTKYNKIGGDEVGKRHRYWGRGQEEEPPIGQERNTPTKRKGEGRERPVLGARIGPRMDEDPAGPRQRVAGGPLGYKHRMMGKGDGTEKRVRLAPQNSPRRVRRRGARGIGRDG